MIAGKPTRNKELTGQMRLIPKKSKLNTTVWKNFTLIDMVLIGALIGFAYVIIRSNLAWKWYLLAGYAFLSVALMFPADDSRVYREIFYLIRYIFTVKLFSADRKAQNKRIDALIPQTGLRDDGVIEYGGEYYGGVLSVGATEFRLLNEFGQNAKISGLSKILNALTSDQSAQIVKIDRPVNFDEISGRLYGKLEAAAEESPADPAKAAILRSRLDQIDNLNNIEKQYRPYYYFVVYDPSLDSLQSTLDFVQSAFYDLELAARRLDAKEIAVFLKYCYTRDFDERDIEDFEPAGYLEFVKPKQVKFGSAACAVDGVAAFSYAVADYPLSVTNAWGAELFNLDNTKAVLNIRPVDKERSVKRIDRAVNEIATKENVNKTSQMIAQQTHVDTMVELAQSLQNENESLFDCTLTVTGFNYGGENMRGFKKRIRRAMSADGFRTNVLFCRQSDAFISSSVTRRNRLRGFERGINSESLAAVFPFVFTSVIEPDGLTLGHNQYPLILDIWKWKTDTSGMYVNANAFCIGKSGSGKSYFTKLLLSLLYGDGCKIYILDPENEYNALCHNLGGAFIDVGNATAGRLNPFQIYDILTDDGKPAPSDVVFWSHMRILEKFFRVTLPELPSGSHEELNNLVVECYAGCGILPETECRRLAPGDFPTFDGLLGVVRKKITQEKNPLRVTDLQRVETYVMKFAEGGRYSNLWNGPSTLATDERFIVFNFQSLLSSKNPTVSNGQMILIMRYLEQQIINMRELNRAGHKIMHPVVAIDEGYNFVDARYSVALDFVYEQYKKIRKYDGMIMFLTQNLNDLLGNPEVIGKTSAIINNSQYSFVFSLSPADLEILTQLYANVGEINETERNEIANAKKGQCFLISAPRSRTSFRVVAGDAVRTLFERELSEKEMGALAGPFGGVDLPDGTESEPPPSG
jgi:hypothetical protein